MSKDGIGGSYGGDYGHWSDKKSTHRSGPMYVDGTSVESDRIITTDPDGWVIKEDVRKHDMVNEPPHYKSHPSGVECIQITEHMGFNLGNAVKYIWRSDLKGKSIEDLEKAKWYITREIEKRSK